MTMWRKCWASGRKVCYKNKVALFDFSNSIAVIRMYVTIAAILEVGPNDVFLGEAEHAKPAPTHGGVYGDPRVSHQLGAFIKSHPADNTARISIHETHTKVRGQRPL